MEKVLFSDLFAGKAGRRTLDELEKAGYATDNLFVFGRYVTDGGNWAITCYYNDDPLHWEIYIRCPQCGRIERKLLSHDELVNIPAIVDEFNSRHLFCSYVGNVRYLVKETLTDALTYGDD